MPNALTGTLAAIGREALRIVLSSWCIVCGDELLWRHRKASCCDRCWNELPKMKGSRCRSCARPWSGGDSDEFLCIECSVRPMPVDWCDSWGHYAGSLERVLHAFKFEQHDFLAAPFGALLAERLEERGDVRFDVIACVPMHRGKERRRGYNQAALVAGAVARRVNIPFDRSLLTKNAERETQSTLSRGARAENVRGVFSATTQLKDDSILIVDDICTTGETLRACAEVLLQSGAARVCALTIAKASK